MIVIIAYDMGNVGSITNMINKVGGQFVISNDHQVIEAAAKLVLPGVGAFDTSMSNIERFGLQELLRWNVLHEKTPNSWCLFVDAIAWRKK